MRNKHRLPPRDDFPRGFITDTYRNIKDEEGYEESLPIPLGVMEKDSWDADARPGSVLAQKLALFWSMHEQDFWNMVVQDVR